MVSFRTALGRCVHREYLVTDAVPNAPDPAYAWLGFRCALAVDPFVEDAMAALDAQAARAARYYQTAAVRYRPRRIVVQDDEAVIFVN